MNDPMEQLDPLEPQAVSWLVEWTTQETSGDAVSPLQAAASAWRDAFGRSQATDGDACVFVVRHPITGRAVTIDLANYDLENLRPWGGDETEEGTDG